MYFGFFVVGKDESERVELAIAPDKHIPGTGPIPVSKLKPTNTGYFFVGYEESIKVELDQEGSMIIQAVKPSKLYLSPNRPEKPGFAVNKIAVRKDHSLVFYDRDKGWEEFLPNKKDY